MTLNFSEILVTGGAGFIGSHIVDRLINEGIKVRALDNFSTGEKNNLTQHKNNQTFQLIKGDIRNTKQVKKAVKGVDAVIHEAALVSVTRSIEDPQLSNEINVTGTTNILKACIDTNVKRFVYASSCAVYGDTEKLPLSENMTPNPLSPYATDKLTSEKNAKTFHDVYGLETVCLRYFNVYGPRQKHGPYSGVISIVINSLLKNKPPTIYGDGKQTRDFVNIKDVVEANMLALSRQEAVGKVFNIATGKATSINSLIKTVQKIMNKTTVNPVYAESRPGDIKHSYGNIANAQTHLGYIPKIRLEDGLTELIQWGSKH